MAKSKEERLNDIHDTAIRGFDKVQSALRDERLQCLEDRRFYSIAGAQWEGPLQAQFENKPRFEFNKIHLAVIRIINEYRNNRVQIEFVSKDGSDKDKLSDACADLFRADENDSCAEEAYDNAFEEAVGGGFGAFRLRADYEDEEDEDNDYQRIRFEPIFDADSSVFFDLNAKRQDKSDAQECWVLSSLTHDAFVAEWDEDPSTWPKTIFKRFFDWCTPDLVYVAEYYKVEKISTDVYTYEGVGGDIKKVSADELEEDADLEDTLSATGYKRTKTKKVKKQKVHKYIMSGKGVLEDCGHIAGKHIPVVPVYGKRWFVDNVERCMGHVRLAKDSQRIANMQRSKLGEISALSSVEKPIFAPEQISSHQIMWSEDNIKNYPFLLANPLTDGNGQVIATGPLAYTRAPQIPPAMAALLQITEQDMQDLLGNQQAGEQLQANISGKAVELIQSKLDMQTFIYVSNFAKAKKRGAEIWLSMAKDIMADSGRVTKGVDSQGKTRAIEIKKPIIDEDSSMAYENDIEDAEFDIDYEIGPSSQSKKQATVRALTGMMQITQDPEVQQVLGSMAMMNMEGEGISDVRDYFRKKLVTIGAVKPNEEEQQQMAASQQNQQPDPNAEFLQSQAKKAVSDTYLNVAKAKKTEAETVQILSGIELSHKQHVVKTAQAIHDMMPNQTSGEIPQ